MYLRNYDNDQNYATFSELGGGGRRGASGSTKPQNWIKIHLKPQNWKKIHLKPQQKFA